MHNEKARNLTKGEMDLYQGALLALVGSTRCWATRRDSSHGDTTHFLVQVNWLLSADGDSNCQIRANFVQEESSCGLLPPICALDVLNHQPPQPLPNHGAPSHGPRCAWSENTCSCTVTPRSRSSLLGHLVSPAHQQPAQQRMEKRYITVPNMKSSCLDPVLFSIDLRIFEILLHFYVFVLILVAL